MITGSSVLLSLFQWKNKNVDIVTMGSLSFGIQIHISSDLLLMGGSDSLWLSDLKLTAFTSSQCHLKICLSLVLMISYYCVYLWCPNHIQAEPSETKVNC